MIQGADVPSTDCTHATAGGRQRRKSPDIVHKSKKQRITEDQTKCTFFFSKKNRHCGMQRKSGFLFCGLHLEEQQDDTLERAQCPYGNHTVWKKLLKKHIETCPEFLLQKKLKSEAYYEPGINRNQTSNEGAVQLPSINDFSGNQKDTVNARRMAAIMRMGEDRFTQLIDKIESLWSTLGCQEPSAPNRVDKVRESERHYLQHVSIYKHMDDMEFFKESSSTIYMEFGSGKGFLTRSLVDLASPKSLHRIILLDRKTFKEKADKFLRGNNATRLRCNIADFNPSKLEGLDPKSKIVVYAKHLCGEATDFAIRCIGHQVESNRPIGFAIASCCHHLTSWDQYVGARILEREGITPEEFEIMCYMSGWSTCGSHVKYHGTRCQQDEHSGIDDVWKPHKTMSRVKREELGTKCKDLIDKGRILYCTGLDGMNTAKNVYYVDPVISKENRLLLGHAC